MTLLDQQTRTAYVPVCLARRLTPDRGVAALVDGTPVAVFRLATGDLHAVDNIDPISGANVLSRGIVGEADGRPTIASPLYKQRFDLRTGECLDADASIAVHAVREIDGMVHVRVTS
jgi:nitrite reductase (NADH) small subunit